MFWVNLLSALQALRNANGRFVVSSSDKNPLYLIHSHFVVPPVIECCRARRFMSGHLLRELAPTAIAQILPDPRRAKRVIADPSLDPGCKRAPRESEQPLAVIRAGELLAQNSDERAGVMVGEPLKP
jgi:hypothetical protein